MPGFVFPLVLVEATVTIITMWAVRQHATTVIRQSFDPSAIQVQQVNGDTLLTMFLVFAIGLLLIVTTLVLGLEDRKHRR